MYYAILDENYVIDVVNSNVAPTYPKTSIGKSLVTIETDENTKIGMYYNKEDQVFYFKEIEKVQEPEPEPSQPTNQDIMDKLNTMTTGQVSTAELDAAYREGVNAYE